MAKLSLPYAERCRSEAPYRMTGVVWEAVFAFYLINFGCPIRREYHEAPVPQAPVVDQYPDGWP